MRALLIEDDSAVANSIELMLKSAGLNLYTTDLGEEGIDLGKIYAYNIIVLDLSLPDISGFEVLRKLRASKVQFADPDPLWPRQCRRQDQRPRFRRRRLHDETVSQGRIGRARIKALVRRSKGHAQ